MKLFALFGKRAEEDTTEKQRKENDLKELEIYSGMRVVVEALDGQVLFIARLQDPQRRRASLYQYSDTQILQAADKGACREKTPVQVKIRGYNDRRRKAVFMEGRIAPEQAHIWQVQDLVVTGVEDERSYVRLDTDIDAVVAPSGKTDADEEACKLLNISVGGAGIGSARRYHKGDRFLLKVKLLEDRPPSVMYCEVLRVAEKDRARFEYGCQFLVLTEADQAQIAQTVAAIAESSKDSVSPGALMRSS